MTRLSFSLVLLLHILAPLGISSDDNGLANGLRRWAIIASPEIVRDALPDLLTASLSADETIELVERQELAAVERELQLAAYVGATAGRKRLQLGRILHADALVLLVIEKPFNKAPADTAPMLKIVVVECRSGTRLLVDYLSYNNDNLALTAEQSVTVVNRIRRRFPNGIERTICVTPFLSRNLVHDYDDLQSGFFGLLSNALTAFPGVAVVETEEARSIGRELELGDTGLKHRNVPVLVEGEFRVAQANGSDGPHVTLVIRIADARNVRRTIELKDLPLNEIAASLSTQLPRTVLQIAADDSTKPLSMQAQFEQLVSQAGRFSQVGAWERSFLLREAALLLKPDAAELRITSAICG